MSLIGTGLAVPWACSSADCSGPGGLCVDIPKGTANRGGLGGSGGENDAGMAGETPRPSRGGSSGKGGSSGSGGKGGSSDTTSRGGSGTGGTRVTSAGGMLGDNAGGASPAGEAGSGTVIGIEASGGTGGTGAVSGSGGANAGGTQGKAGGKNGGGARSGGGSAGVVGAGGNNCTITDIPDTCGAAAGAAGESGAGAGGGGNEEGWCAVPDAGAGGQASTSGTGGTLASISLGLGGTGVASGGSGASKGGVGPGPSGGRGGTGQGGAAGVAGPPSFGGTAPSGGTRTLFPIDDLEDGDAWVGPVLGARGNWYIASEGPGATFPTSGCTPVSSSATEFVDHASNAAMHFYGSGSFSFAQVGISVRSGAPSCDQPLVATGMTGVRFWAKGTSVPQYLSFMLGTPETTPPEYGGTCSSNCWAYPRMLPMVIDDTWREYFVPFSSMSPPPQSSSILSLIWEAQQSSCFDFWLDDVAFYQDQ